MLFFIPMYFKVYPTMAVAGFLFGLARSRICDWVYTCQPVLEAVLGKNMDLLERQISLVDLGYKGLENGYEGITIPHKKPRKGMRKQDKGESHIQRGNMSRYSKGKKKRWFGE
jgi:hypothetical protein